MVSGHSRAQAHLALGGPTRSNLSLLSLSLPCRNLKGKNHLFTHILGPRDDSPSTTLPNVPITRGMYCNNNNKNTQSGDPGIRVWGKSRTDRPEHSIAHPARPAGELGIGSYSLSPVRVLVPNRGILVPWFFSGHRRHRGHRMHLWHRWHRWPGSPHRGSNTAHGVT